MTPRLLETQSLPSSLLSDTLVKIAQLGFIRQSRAQHRRQQVPGTAQRVRNSPPRRHRLLVYRFCIPCTLKTRRRGLTRHHPALRVSAAHRRFRGSFKWQSAPARRRPPRLWRHQRLHRRLCLLRPSSTSWATPRPLLRLPRHLPPSASLPQHLQCQHSPPSASLRLLPRSLRSASPPLRSPPPPLRPSPPLPLPRWRQEVSATSAPFRRRRRQLLRPVLVRFGLP